MNRQIDSLLRLVPGGAGAQAQIGIWRAQMRELRPLFPIVLPYLLWVYYRAYQKEQDRLRRQRLAPILRPGARLPEQRVDG